uniref:Alkaline serine protease n=1 Tax=Vibrio alginolyticus TaxID=663 RepID=Q3LRY5_VIBAL|nr:alkaline serine protease [Vibrio alginolyticus]
MHYTTNKALGAFTLTAVAVAASAVAAPMGFDESKFPTKYIVKFKEHANARSAMAGPRMVQETVLQQVNARKVERLGNRAIYSVEMDGNDLEELRNRGDVDYVEVDPPRYLLRETTPWGYGAVGAHLLDDFNAGNRTVCIIDSGYDLSHNDLSGNRVNGTNDSGTGSWSDPGNNNAHGTHVAGTIAAIANNEGVKGIMPNHNVNLHIVNVFNEAGWGYSSGLVKAIQTCADNGANVVNMSLGGSQSSTEENALKTIYDQGVLLIAAAGNDGNTAHSYPASYDSVMSAAAVDNDHAAFSQATNQVEIAAPGVAITTVTVSSITLVSQFDRVVPHNRLVHNGTQLAPVAGPITATLASYTGGNNCGDMSGKICLTEGNQGSAYPEVDAVKACYNAGASAADSNWALPGLQNPFLVDANMVYRMVSMTVRAFGLELQYGVGQEMVATTTGEDYEYYTSMATPHVTVAGLVWSFHPTTAAQVRNALIKTATDIDVAGRDNRTGYGLNADAAAYLDAGCNGPVWGVDPTYTNTNYVAIPDNKTSGVISALDVDRTGDAVVSIDVDISHTYIGDLKVTLTSPTGGQVVLHDNNGGSANDIKYQVDSGFESQGVWELKAVDSARRDTGTINSWTLTFQ